MILKVLKAIGGKSGVTIKVKNGWVTGYFAIADNIFKIKNDELKEGEYIVRKDYINSAELNLEDFEIRDEIKSGYVGDIQVKIVKDILKKVNYIIDKKDIRNEFKIVYNDDKLTFTNGGKLYWWEKQILPTKLNLEQIELLNRLLTLNDKNDVLKVYEREKEFVIGSPDKWVLYGKISVCNHPNYTYVFIDTTDYISISKEILFQIEEKYKEDRDVEIYLYEDRIELKSGIVQPLIFNIQINGLGLTSDEIKNKNLILTITANNDDKNALCKLNVKYLLDCWYALDKSNLRIYANFIRDKDKKDQIIYIEEV